MFQSVKYVYIALAILTLSACKTPKDIEVSEQGAVASEALVFALDSLSEKSFESYYTKIATSYQDSSRSLSFKTSAWMVADSAANFLITFAKFPVVGALVTKDSVHVVNRREKCFKLASLDLLSNQFGTQLTLDNLQDILLGIPTNFNKENTYYQTSPDKSLTLCTHGKKDIEQIRLENSDSIVTYYTLTEDLSELEKMTLISFKDTTEIHLVYNSREMIDGFNAPTSATVRILTPEPRDHGGARIHKNTCQSIRKNSICNSGKLCRM